MTPRALLLTLILLSSASLTAAMLTTGHDWGDDFAGYITQGASLVHGGVRASVARTAFTMQQSSRSYAPHAYPWGFPALLAPVYALCGGVNMFCFKLIGVAVFAVFLAAFFVFLTGSPPRLPLADRTIVVSILAFAPAFLAFQNNVLSDIPFLCASTLSILAIDRVIVSPGKWEGAPLANIWMGALFAATYCMRTNGILFVPTLLATQAYGWWRHRAADHARPGDARRAVTIALLPHVTFGVITLALLRFLPGGEASYLSHFHLPTGESLSLNLSTYANLPVEFLDPLPYPAAVACFMLPFTVAGIVRHVRDDFHVVVYLALTLLLLFVWPEPQGLRYLFPLIPFLLAFTYRGMQTAVRLLAATPSTGRPAAGQVLRGLWAGVFVLFVATSVADARANLARGRAPEEGPFDPVSREMFTWVTAHTAPADVVIFPKPRVMRLMTDRDSLLIDRCDQLDRGQYMVLRKNSDADQVAPSAVANCSAAVEITPVFENARFTIYRITTS